MHAKGKDQEKEKLETLERGDKRLMQVFCGREPQLDRNERPKEPLFKGEWE